MNIKAILATAFAMLMMVNISTAMADDHESNDDNKKVEDTNNDTKSAAPTICKCGTTVKTELEKKADKADKDADKADKDAEKADKAARDADKYYKDIKDSEDVSEDDKDQAKSDKDSKDEDKSKADKDKSKADKDKSKADKDVKDEEEKNASKYGACVCPNGVTSYSVPAGAASSSSNASTSAFREVRGQ